LNRFFIDTNVYASFKLGEVDTIEKLAHAGEILLSSIVLGELHAGFVTGTRAARNRDELDQFLASPRVKTIAIDDGTAEFYASVYRNLRKSGTPIPTNDMWIAASCL
jgi:predicted nucleic acid-binding protein